MITMVASPIIVIIGAVHFLRVRHRLEQEAERRKQVAARIEQEYREAREEQLEN